MASNCVIVAIPSDDDYTWKISSEKVPHMTLLFLGETLKVQNLTSILEYVQHASTRSLKKFYMDVERRGTLGEDEADVLFFSKSYIEDVTNFRSYLLKDNNIHTAYDSVPQFPEWQPHLTLGYPGSPAKEDKRDYPGIHGVHFDRIAVWFGDYEGPEFTLPSYDWGMEVSMSSIEEAKTLVEASIAHFGVKGMQWGVRKRDTGPVNVSTTTKTSVRGKAVIKTEGGKNQPAHPDAIAAKVAKQKLHKSGVNALSNQELQVFTNRAGLELRVQQLDPSLYKQGTKFAGEFMKSPEGQLTVKAVKKGATSERGKKIKKKLIVGAAKAAVAVAL